MRSYVAIHLSLVFATGALVTGSIWAKASWGHWWVWSEPVLVSFLIVFLLYCCYQPLRFSIEDPERQARYASVFAIAAGAFVPINFAAVRLATAHIHPRVLSKTGGALPGEMRLTFLVALAGAGAGASSPEAERSSASASSRLRRRFSLNDAFLAVSSKRHSVANRSATPSSDTRNVSRISPGICPPVFDSTRGWMCAVASRTAAKLIGTNAPAAIANTDA